MDRSITPDTYSDFLEIDESDLDNEVARLPTLYYTVSDFLAEAVYERDRLKNRCDKEHARISNEYRRELERDKVKYTEGKLSALVETSDEYQEALSRYLKAKLVADKWQALKEGFQQKSFSLRLRLQSITEGNFQSDSYRNKRADEGRQALAERRRERARRK